MHADILPIPEFFQPSNLSQIMSGAKEHAPRHAILENFEAMTHSYQQNLFAP